MRIPWLLIAALLGGIAVVMGALGRHALSGDEGALELHHTAQTYLMFHVFALITVWILAERSTVSHKLVTVTGLLFLFGIFLFSGSLFYLSQTGTSLVPFGTPTGGMLLILGWFSLAICGFQEWREVAKP